MKVIVPAFLSESEHFWLSPEGSRVLSNWMERLASLDIDILVAGDACPILNMAQKKGLAAHKCPASEDLAPFPAGLKAVVKCLAGPNGRTEPFAALNFRSPLLRSRTLAAALEAGKQAAGPMGTFSPLADHLPQCRTLWEIVQGDFLLIIDEAEEERAHVTSRPFLADSLALWQKNNFAPAYSKLDGALETISAKDTDHDIVIMQEGDGYRVMANSSLRCGEAFTWNKQDVLSLHRLPDGDFRLHAERIPDGGFLLRLLRLNRDGQLGDTIGTHHLTLRRPDVTLRGEDLAGMLFMLYKSAPVCSEIRQPFCPEDAPWGVDIYARPVDKLSGKVLHGRQVMPVCHSLDGRLFVFPQGTSATELLGISNFEAFEIGEEEGPFVRNKIDLLRCIIQMGRGNRP